MSSILFFAHFMCWNSFWKNREARLDKTTFINLLNVSCLQSNTSAVISTSAINSIKTLVKLH